MPFFSMVRRPLVEIRRLTQRRSPSNQKRWVCRFGRKRRRFLLLAWETRLPTATLLPVTSQTRLIKYPENQLVNYLATGLRPPKGRSLYQPAPRAATSRCAIRESRPGSTVRRLEFDASGLYCACAPSKQPTLRERQAGVITHDEVIEHADIHQSQSIA